MRIIGYTLRVVSLIIGIILLTVIIYNFSKTNYNNFESNPERFGFIMGQLFGSVIILLIPYLILKLGNYFLKKDSKKKIINSIEEIEGNKIAD